jgi:hypothetical protein
MLLLRGAFSKTMYQISTNISLKTKYNSAIQNKLNLVDFCRNLKLEYQPYFFQIKLMEQILKREEDTYLLITTREIGKTDFITCLLTLYTIYSKPEYTYMLIMGTFEKAKNLLEKIKFIVEENKDTGLFDAIFDKKSFTKTKCRTLQNKSTMNKTPSISLGSVSTPLRGYRFDEIVLDDIISTENSIYKKKREMAWRCYSEALSVAKKGRVLIIGNISHPDDLYSNLRYSLGLGKDEIPNSDLRIHKSLVKNLDELRLKGKPEFDIQANYELKIIDDERLPFFNVKVANLRIEECNHVAFIDFSTKGKDSHACTIIFEPSINSKKIFMLGYASHGTWEQFLKNLIPIFLKYKITDIHYESNNISEILVDSCVAYSGLEFNPSITKKNKEKKISLLFPFKKDIVLIKSLSKELDIEFKMNQYYINQFLNYTQLENCLDDAVDSAVMALEKLGRINI